MSLQEDNAGGVDWGMFANPVWRALEFGVHWRHDSGSFG